MLRPALRAGCAAALLAPVTSCASAPRISPDEARAEASFEASFAASLAATPAGVSQPTVPAPAATAATQSPRGSLPTGTTVVAIGDSTTGGTALGGVGAAGWPQLLGAQRHWRVIKETAPRTGYLNGGPTGSATFATHVPATIALHPALVIIMGSRNDAGAPAEQITTAASAMLARLHAGLPGARVVVIGPLAGSAPPAPGLLTDRDAVQVAARAAGATFIDPIAQGWFAGTSAQLFAADGVHPTDAGHGRQAALVAADLLRAGI